jgi:copper(I)-binding protein
MTDHRYARTACRALVAAVALAAVLGACSGSDAEPGTTSSGSATTTTMATAATVVGRITTDGVTVDGAWARTSPAGAVNGAVYLRITADADDALTGAAVASDVAVSAEVHETVMGSPSASGTGAGASPTMSMREVARIPIPAGTTVEMKPGGYHIMLLGLAEPLVRGGTISVTLSFEQVGPVTVEVPVADTAP